MDDEQPRTERIVTVTRRLPLVTKDCPVCGRTFTGARWRRYDTSACARRADYARHAVQRRAARREKYRREKKQPPA
jgi:hypothetical protein